MDSYRKKRILIIAEGFEEKPYIDKLFSFPNINKDAYDIRPAVNAKGNAKILARYQYEFQRNFYDLILIFCDVDRGKEDFAQLVEQMGAFFKNKNDSIKVFIFANPVTLQIVLSHFGEAKITKSGKKSNADIIEQLVGIKDYDAKSEQINEMINKVHYSSLDSFKKRLKSISTNYKDIPSTNILEFIERFENNNTDWIDAINALMS